jgi:AbrB family looped-hinge helix DNA binding protein
MEATVTLSSKNQIVVPKSVRQKLGIGPGDRLVVQVGKEGVVLRPKPKSYTSHLRGLHQSIWKGIEAKRYVEGERNSWEKE